MMYLGNQPVGINKIEEKSPSWISKMNSMQNMFTNKTFLDESLIVDFEGASMTGQASAAFQGVSGLKYVTIKNASITSSSFEAFIRNASVESITFENCTVKPASMRRFAYKDGTGSLPITEINGEIDMVNCTNVDDVFGAAQYLESVRFTENSIKITISFSVCPFDDATLVNIGNALNNTVTGKTITLSTAKKTRCGTLMGQDVNGTFVADATGSMSLESFITTIKGWTLA